MRGPELVRTAAVHGDTLALTGDTKDPAEPQVWGPAAKVTWNGAPVTGALPGAPAVTLPELGGWRYRPESPEAQPGFDDST